MTIIQANKFFFPKGGAERYMLDLTAFLESHGHAVVPFAMRHPDNAYTRYRAYFPRFVPTERVQVSPAALRTVGRMFYSFEAKRKMRALVRDVAPELVHIHNIYNQISPSILAPIKRQGIPIVMTVHDHHLTSPQYSVWAEDCGPDLSDAGIAKATLSRFHKDSYAASFLQAASHRFARAFRFYERHVDLFFAPTQAMKRRLVRGGFPKEKIRVNPYGIDPALVDARKDHDGYFLYVGRLVPEKGVETVLEIARLLPDQRFKIVGTGPDEQRLHAIGHGLANVEFLGFQSGDTLRELYQGAQALLFPSRWEETFGLTLLEAMAAGKPCIASGVGGVPEVVEDGVTGFLVRPLDLRGWVEAVMRLAYDEDRRAQMGREARTAVETTFHIDRHWRRVLHGYTTATRGAFES